MLQLEIHLRMASHVIKVVGVMSRIADSRSESLANETNKPLSRSFYTVLNVHTSARLSICHSISWGAPFLMSMCGQNAEADSSKVDTCRF